MFAKRSKKQSDTVPRRRRIVEDDIEMPAGTSVNSSNNQFRRNQTLSSYRHNTPEESSRQKVHHLALQRRKLSGIFFVVAAATVLLIVLLWQLMAQVHVVTSTKQLGASFDSTRYEEMINEYLAVNPAQRLRFALNEHDLTNYVASRLPEVEALSLTGAAGIAQSNFAVTFRTPVAGWQIDGTQYYVDADGVVFDMNYYTTPTVQIVDESGISPEQGTAVASTRLLGFLGRVVAQAGERGYTVTRAVLPADTTRQLDIYVEGSDTRLKLSVDRGAGEQVEDADRVLKQLATQGSKPEYVDVRVAGRAAYR